MKIIKAQKGWKALENIQYEVIPDTNFTSDKTGAGDIEVMYKDTPSKGYEYANGFKYAHPKVGHNVIIYNPKTNDEQDIKLDALHIMRKDDPIYGALLDKLSYYAQDGDVAYNAKRRMAEDIQKYGRLNPGDNYQQYFDNEVDGLLRNMLIEGSPEYIKSKRYYPDKEQLKKWNEHLLPYINEIKKYLETGERPEYVLPAAIITNKHGGRLKWK